MGGYVSAALQETKKTITECLEKKEDIVVSPLVLGSISALTEPDMKLLVEWCKDKNLDILIVVASVYLNGSTTIVKSPKEAFLLIKFVADQNNPNACYKLATFYRDGIGSVVNLDEAKKMMEKAAELKSSGAMIWLGAQYDSGSSGYKIDHFKSFKYYMDAINNDPTSRVAAYNIGCHYHEGFSVEKNYLIALEWFQKASDLGDVDAMLHIAMMYKHGHGVPVSLEKTVKTYEKILAIDPWNYRAMYNLSHLCHDKKQRIELLEKGILVRHGESYNSLGLIYLNGEHPTVIEKNEEKGIAYLIKAAELGVTVALYNLGNYFATKPGEQFQALKFFNEAKKKFKGSLQKKACEIEINKLFPLCKNDFLALLDNFSTVSPPTVDTDENDIVTVSANS